MSKFGYGVGRAISEIVAGIVTSTILVAFMNSGLLNPSFMLLFHLINILSTIALIFAVPFWATSYILRWLFGLWIMFSSRLVGILELLVYLVPLIILIIRFLKKCAFQ
jgi:hypothetical protein